MNFSALKIKWERFSSGLWFQKYATRILLICVLIIMVIILNHYSPYFLTLKNLKNILNQTSTYLLLSVGMTFVIISGGIDLSVGSIMAASAVAMGFAMGFGLPVWAAILLGLALGTLIGALSGLIISQVGINALIVTLSMASIVRGAVILITNGKPIYGFSSQFTYWGSAGNSLMNPPIVISLAIMIIGVIVLEHTRLGRYCFTLGSNESALRKSGIKVYKYKMAIYAISGLCAALAGFIVAARLNTAEPLAGMGYEMDAIAATVLGGTLIQGGNGSVSGTFIACLILAVMRNGLTVLTISSNYQQLLTGIIVMVAVAITELRKRNSREA